jgi:hypothetical protein
MTSFFVPEESAAGSELAYAEIRRLVTEDTGRAGRVSRILELDGRRGGRDCVTRVGEPDPITGELVLAILDLGPHSPFVVYTRADDGSDTIHELLRNQVYGTTEFSD